MLVTEEVLAAAVAERERELKEHSRLRQAHRFKNDELRSSHTWTWQVEPGMQEEFEALRAWLLSGLDEG
jgi:hypothetical protein